MRTPWPGAPGRYNAVGCPEKPAPPPSARPPTKQHGDSSSRALPLEPWTPTELCHLMPPTPLPTPPAVGTWGPLARQNRAAAAGAGRRREPRWGKSPQDCTEGPGTPCPKLGGLEPLRTSRRTRLAGSLLPVAHSRRQAYPRRQTGHWALNTLGRKNRAQKWAPGPLLPPGGK